MKRILRYIIAIIFIISGLVKAIDPVGFSFKLEEYFSPTVFNIPALQEYALPISIFVIVVELVLGLFLLMSIRLKFTLWSLIALCIFFGFLTFYSAYYNVVTDCGCFGDAIKFTPWQSFTKDIVLLLGLLLLWRQYQNTNQLDKNFGCVKLPVFGIFALGMGYIMYHGIRHEPVKDFRDYKIGTDLIMEKAKIAQNPSEYKTQYVLKNSKTNEVLKVNQDDYIAKNYWQDENWQIQSDQTKSVISKQGYVSAIDKFHLEDENGNDVTETILKAPKAVLLFTYKPKEVDKNLLLKYENFIKGNAVVYGISTEKNTFTQLKNLTMDGTAIKTIARSNPFILILENGKIVEKMNMADYVQ